MHARLTPRSSCPHARAPVGCPFGHGVRDASTAAVERDAPARALDVIPEDAQRARAHAVEQLLAALDECVDPRTGFLPARTPVYELPAPFSAISAACAQLSARYHGPDNDVRPWLQALFAEPAREQLAAIDELDEHTLQSLMTQTSLLAHAYRWRSAPTSAELYRAERVALPRGLEALWTRLAARMGIPRVGVFYTMVCNNWRLSGKGPGEPYDPDELTDERFELAHPWLQAEGARELRSFVLAAIGMEARGARVLQIVRRVVVAVVDGDREVVVEQLGALERELKTMGRHFNQHIRKSRIRPESFRELIQPTMVWLLDHGQGPLEGASGPQACVIQLIDSLLGVSRDSVTGRVLLKSRAYMLPGHRRLLAACDRVRHVLRAFVITEGDAETRQRFDACVTQMLRWRQSHKRRGAYYIRGEGSETSSYASTGLVVKLESDHSRAFEASMEDHMQQTRLALSAA